MHAKKRGFVKIPNDIARGGHRGINLAVLVVICSHGKCTASASTIGREVGCGEKSVRRSFCYWKQFAKETGLLIWIQERHGKSTYTIRVSFPGIATSGDTAEETAEFGHGDRMSWSGSPIKNTKEQKQEKRDGYDYFREPTDGPYATYNPQSPEEKTANSARILDAAIKSNPKLEDLFKKKLKPFN